VWGKTNMKKNEQKKEEEISDDMKAMKMQSLRDMISSAEKTIQGAKAMLLQLEGKKKSGRRRKSETDEEGTIVEGSFDGQIMIGVDGKQYPVPANYASKSKLVEGDMLKLTITPDGSFIYKQIGPAERKRLIGIVSQDEAGNYYIIADGRPYKVLLASVTYFKAEPGDEAVIVIPRDIESDWSAVENILQKGKEKTLTRPMGTMGGPATKKYEIDDEVENWKSDVENDSRHKDILDEWAQDLGEIQKESQKSEV
jgi:hypothetical protein